ncbi:hypothetical protein FALBO_1444 [Fusarium albosuccineum]|uniref:Uncharacterized protein n=1 Tax=Fusarium albosuccineum TaxID=1237068 RepID=A0A8H4LQ52_9HYPO|nr:hypothetical protein FALBO_1444 [Fusarium albosuccineum]
MEHPRHLLTLPYEVRDLIWAFAAASGDANGLMRCCRRTADEFSRHCDIPERVLRLTRLRILVDSTYVQGVWLKFEYSWEEDGQSFCAVRAVHDMDDPIAQRLIKIKKAKEIVIQLRAPRRGHFVGSFLMILAKVDDVYHLIHTMTTDPGTEGSNPLTITFTTEPVQPGQSRKEAKNFWECRAPQVLQERFRKWLVVPGQMPCFYEYFLNNNPVHFDHEPVVNFVTWPRAHVHRKETYGPETFKIISSLYRWDEKGMKRRAISSFLAEVREERAKLLPHSVKMMTHYRKKGGNTSAGELSESAIHHWEHLNYDIASLKSRYQFLLDNLPGPVGGCLDMLRLHRFRTMDATEANFFARSNRAGRGDHKGLCGASFEINHRLRALFNPVALERARAIRSSCPHLGAVRWAVDTSVSPRLSCPRSLWLKNYPNGIRYHWKGRNLVEWRMQWKTQKHEELLHWVWLNKWWDCLGCCQDSLNAMDENLVHPVEQLVEKNWDVFRKAHHNASDPRHCPCPECSHLDRPVALRRECIRPVRHRNTKRNRFSGFSYRCLALECEGWSKGATDTLTFRRECKSWSCCYSPCRWGETRRVKST